MSIKSVALVAGGLAVGFGLGQVHTSNKAKELTMKAETAITKNSKEVGSTLKKSAKALSKNIGEFIADEE